MAAKHMRGLSPSELDFIVEVAWDKTFDLSGTKVPELPARIRSALLGSGKMPSQR
jgi:hypothetical protein